MRSGQLLTSARVVRTPSPRPASNVEVRLCCLPTLLASPKQFVPPASPLCETILHYAANWSSNKPSTSWSANAPFEHIEPGARAVIVGITPGAQQAANALAAVQRHLLAANNDDPKPFVWTATAERNLIRRHPELRPPSGGRRRTRQCAGARHGPMPRGSQDLVPACR